MHKKVHRYEKFSPTPSLWNWKIRAILASPPAEGERDIVVVLLDWTESDLTAHVSTWCLPCNQGLTIIFAVAWTLVQWWEKERSALSSPPGSLLLHNARVYHITSNSSSVTALWKSFSSGVPSLMRSGRECSVPVHVQRSKSKNCT
jgi:hypothetical protein